MAGLADTLRAQGRAVMGPGADGALLEGSKAFMKEVLNAAAVPTAAFASFDALESAAAMDYLESLPGPWVIKTDGLAAGKGVLVAQTLDEARRDVAAKLSGPRSATLGAASSLRRNWSARNARCSCSATARTPCRWCPRRTSSASATAIPARTPAVWGPTRRCRTWTGRRWTPSWTRPSAHWSRSCAAAGIDYRGVLYAGLMLTAAGPKVIEYNVRFGDPEAEVVLPLLDADAAELFLAVANGELEGRAHRRSRTMPRSASCWLPRATPRDRARGPPLRAWTPPASRWRPSTASRSSMPAPGATALTDRSTRQGVACSAVTGVAPTLEQARERAYAATAPLTGRACRCAMTSPPESRVRRSGRARGPGDPALRTGGHGGAVQRHGPLLSLARGRVARHRGPGRTRCGAGRGCRDRAEPRRLRSTRSSSPTCSRARGSLTTMSPPSSMWCRSASVRRPARTSTMG